jgi:hypothetical protein
LASVVIACSAGAALALRAAAAWGLVLAWAAVLAAAREPARREVARREGSSGKIKDLRVIRMLVEETGGGAVRACGQAAMGC